MSVTKANLICDLPDTHRVAAAPDDPQRRLVNYDDATANWLSGLSLEP